MSEATESTGTETTEETAAPTEVTTETPATPAPEPPKGYVPSFRLREQTDKAKAAESRAQALEEENARLKATPRAVQEDPPEDLEGPALAKWYVQQGLKEYGPALIKEALGMEAPAAAATLAAVKANQEKQEQAAWSKWDAACQARGLDPKDETVRGLTVALSKMGGDYDDLGKALDGVAALKGKKAANAATVAPVDDEAVTESEGVTTTMTSDHRIPTTEEEAREMAHKGIAATHLPSTEILRRSRAAREKKGK